MTLRNVQFVNAVMLRDIGTVTSWDATRNAGAQMLVVELADGSVRFTFSNAHQCVVPVANIAAKLYGPEEPKPEAKKKP